MKVSIPLPDGSFSIYTYNDKGEMTGHEISDKDIEKESKCPDCGEDVALSGDHGESLIQEVRFKAFTHSSSFVGNVKYDQDNQSMEIILNGSTYDFCNVSERLYDSFEGANSKGAFFNREIKTLHDC